MNKTMVRWIAIITVAVFIMSSVALIGFSIFGY